MQGELLLFKVGECKINLEIVGKNSLKMSGKV